uniref:Uncharacterized protein n=1 Tax=Anguilla anguilla TaxID=7936 RepID=A0A0E9ST42_ANGAN
MLYFVSLKLFTHFCHVLILIKWFILLI